VPKRKPISIEVVEEGDERFMVYTYANGEVVRKPVDDKIATRKPFRPHHRLLDHTEKKRF
jgi:hypothetical protein